MEMLLIIVTTFLLGQGARSSPTEMSARKLSKEDLEVGPIKLGLTVVQQQKGDQPAMFKRRPLRNFEQRLGKLNQKVIPRSNEIQQQKLELKKGKWEPAGGSNYEWSLDRVSDYSNWESDPANTIHKKTRQEATQILAAKPVEKKLAKAEKDPVVHKVNVEPSFSDYTKENKLDDSVKITLTVGGVALFCAIVFIIFSSIQWRRTLKALKATDNDLQREAQHLLEKQPANKKPNSCAAKPHPESAKATSIVGPSETKEDSGVFPIRCSQNEAAVENSKTQAATANFAPDFNAMVTLADTQLTPAAKNVDVLVTKDQKTTIPASNIAPNKPPRPAIVPSPLPTINPPSGETVNAGRMIPNGVSQDEVYLELSPSLDMEGKSCSSEEDKIPLLQVEPLAGIERDHNSISQIDSEQSGQRKDATNDPMFHADDPFLFVSDKKLVMVDVEVHEARDHEISPAPLPESAVDSIKIISNESPAKPRRPSLNRLKRFREHYKF